MEWISVKDRLPDHGESVLAIYKNDYGRYVQIIGHYFERWKEESGCDDDGYDEYSEELDGYYYCEGWYEQQDNWGDYASIHVHEGHVSHWAVLPDPPTGTGGEEGL